MVLVASPKEKALIQKIERYLIKREQLEISELRDATSYVQKVIVNLGNKSEAKLWLKGVIARLDTVYNAVGDLYNATYAAEKKVSDPQEKKFYVKDRQQQKRIFILVKDAIGAAKAARGFLNQGNKSRTIGEMETCYNIIRDTTAIIRKDENLHELMIRSLI